MHRTVWLGSRLYGDKLINTLWKYIAMKVKVRFLSTVYKMVGIREKTFVVHEGASLGDLLKQIDSELNTSLYSMIVDNKANIGILINGRPLIQTKLDDVFLNDGDEVVIFNVAGGG